MLPKGATTNQYMILHSVWEQLPQNTLTLDADEGSRAAPPPRRGACRTLRLVETQKWRYLLRLLLPTSMLFAITAAPPAKAQEVQLHYDWRHSVDPRNNARNFPALTFKDFKSMEFGSFLIKVEADFNGSRNNVSKFYSEISQTLKFWDISKVYSEISQTLKFWDPSVFLHLEYT